MNRQKIITLARLLLGLIFFTFGLNGFLNFMAVPPMPTDAMSFMMGLANAKYFFPFLKAAETLCGALLLANLFVPLALTILAPILLNIILFHAFLSPAGIGLPIALAILNLFLAWTYRENFKPMLEKRPTPSE